MLEWKPIVLLALLFQDGASSCTEAVKAVQHVLFDSARAGAGGARDEGAVLSPGECAAGAGRGLVSWQGQDLASLWGSHTGKMIWD